MLRQLRAASELVQGAARELIMREEVNPSDPALHGYLRFVFNGRPFEALHAVFLDARNGYLTDEIVAPGTSARIEASIRHLIARALNLGAGGVILAHNHPSGRCSPSAADMVATERIRMLGAVIDLALVDHLIITRTQAYSFAKGEVL